MSLALLRPVLSEPLAPVVLVEPLVAPTVLEEPDAALCWLPEPVGLDIPEVPVEPVPLNDPELVRSVDPEEVDVEPGEDVAAELPAKPELLALRSGSVIVVPAVLPEPERPPEVLPAPEPVRDPAPPADDEEAPELPLVAAPGEDAALLLEPGADDADP